MSYIIHKAVELDKVQKKLRPTEDQLRTEYLAQPKYDGCNMVAIKMGNSMEQVLLFSRTGEEVKSADHIRKALGDATFAVAGIYLGEYWHPEIDQPTVSGMFRKKDGTQYSEPFFVIFDYLTGAEWAAGKSNVAYHDRVSRMTQTMGRIPEGKAPFFLAESQGFLVDQGLGTEEAARLLSESGPYDGLILRKPSGTWTQGSSGTTGEIIKIKPTLALDLRVKQIKTDIGEKTGRTVYTLMVELPSGDWQEIGSGVPHKEADVPKVGDIVEIEAMSYSKYGMLREPRFKSVRHDKVGSDAD